MGKRKYSKDELLAEALKFESKIDFKRNSYNMYSATLSYGLMSEASEHMKLVHPRVCNKCSKPKALEDFVKGKKCAEGYTQTCKACNNLRQRTTASTVSQRASRRLSSIKAKETNRQRILDYYNNTLKCSKCNLESDIFDVYDFHHVDSSTKKYTISSIMDYSWSTLKDEIDKCVLLCANCHRILHYNERNKKE